MLFGKEEKRRIIHTDTGGEGQQKRVGCKVVLPNRCSNGAEPAAGVHREDSRRLLFSSTFCIQELEHEKHWFSEKEKKNEGGGRPLTLVAMAATHGASTALASSASISATACSDTAEGRCGRQWWKWGGSVEDVVTRPLQKKQEFCCGVPHRQLDDAGQTSCRGARKPVSVALATHALPLPLRMCECEPTSAGGRAGKEKERRECSASQVRRLQQW